MKDFKLYFFQILIIIAFTVSVCPISAQINFAHVMPPPPAPQVFEAFPSLVAVESKFFDYDNDGDEDLLLTGNPSGSTNTGNTIIKLYENDGGKFINEVDLPFEIFQTSGSVPFQIIDYDSDGLLDILGWSLSWGGSGSGATILKNTQDGFEILNDLPSDSLDCVFCEPIGSIDFGDYDLDGDLDFVFSNNEGTKLFENDEGVYGILQQFDSGVDAYSKFVDVDSDGLLDVFLMRWDDNEDATVFLNEGGLFQAEMEQDGVLVSAINNVEFFDYDQDSDQDLIVSQRSSNRFSVYENIDGLYVSVFSLTFQVSSSLAFQIIDLNDDGLQDIILSGSGDNGIQALMNQGTDGTFPFLSEELFDFLSQPVTHAAAADIDADNDIDLLIARNSYFGDPKVDLVLDVEGSFEIQQNSMFTSEPNGALFIDVNADSIQEILTLGRYRYELLLEDQSDFSNLFTYVDGNYSKLSYEYVNAFLTYAGAHEIVDINGNGIDELIIKGSVYFFNDTIETDREDLDDILAPHLQLMDVQKIVRASDVDGDGDQDLFVSGYDSFGNFGFDKEPRTNLYLNDGLGQYLADDQSVFNEVYAREVEFIDFDLDGDEDLIIYGAQDYSLLLDPSVDLYINQSGIFTHHQEMEVYQHYYVSDVNGDGDNDLVATEYNHNPLVFYSNSSADTINFDTLQVYPSIDTRIDDIVFFDAEGDGDIDMLSAETRLTPYDENSFLYLNNSQGILEKSDIQPFRGVRNAYLDVSDFDNDGDVDVLLSQVDPSQQEPNVEYFTILYDNKSTILDSDLDEIGDDNDNCPLVVNPQQIDSDLDGLGDACDPCVNSPDNIDLDEDIVCDDVDNCQDVYNPGQIDTDSDGIGDMCDSCPNDPENDIDNDGVCADLEIVGCQDPTAVNYNPEATDSGYCSYVLFYPSPPSEILPIESDLGGKPENGFSIYPNPVIDDIVSIIFHSESKNERAIVVNDLQGRLVAKTYASSDQKIVSLSNFNSLNRGMYLVSVQSMNGHALFNKVVIVQ